MRIPDMSPQDAANLVGKYLHDVKPETRLKFIELVTPIIEKYDDTVKMPNEFEINGRSYMLDAAEYNDGRISASYLGHGNSQNVDFVAIGVDDLIAQIEKVGGVIK